MEINENLLKKIKNDRFYSKVYEKYKDFNLLIDAGFIDSQVEAKDFYNLNLLTTPVGKLLQNLNNVKNPVVLLSTGGFLPIHEGHINMMELAKAHLEKLGCTVLGGYFSPSHEDYVSTKPYYSSTLGQRIIDCQNTVENSNWLMIDTWESIYVKSYINFTSVIDRLEKYLQLHVDKRIKVAYVFGADNAYFNYCFEEDGIGICINRNTKSEDFYSAKAKIISKNCIFIENFDESFKLSSRFIRNKEDNNNNVSSKLEGNFLIRDEELLPFDNFLKLVNKDNLEKARQTFKTGLIKLYQKEFGKNVTIITREVSKQLEMANNILKDKKTISLDSYFNGTYNLSISREFDISSPQFHYNRMLSRSGLPPLEEQIKIIKSGEYTLVDDDSVSGSTLKSVKALLPKDIKINDIFLLSSLLKEKYFDVVDLRDFIVGANNSGLVTKLPNRTIVRSPYMLPYVNLSTRASIHPDSQMEFSINLWKLNLEFYKSLKVKIKLKDLNNSVYLLMKSIGFKDENTLEDICQWHLTSLLACK